MINVKVKGANTIIRNAGSAKHAGKMGARLGLNGCVKLIKKRATEIVMSRSKYPYTKSGRPENKAIATSWDYTNPEYKAGSVEVVLVNYSPHAKYVEFGTTGPIVSNSGKPLHFRDPGTGRWVTVWSVKGQQPMHFLYDAIQDKKSECIDIFKDDITYWLRTNIRR
jgi:hypothetical protein